ncbi:hypothetical protein MTAT_04490 [Moorella thermoacetica]|uniref:Uncharacterized protein n=1 Tax=Neomoorella thermoacetica TaxID=1525 RepID=A0AAC9MVS5_NEOTH|nr:hypothetical protein [Moorella thermoacetica]AOQ24752.1 hypothetical protein Maut_02324 [Moorella thermoacetica]TYL15710.1 hypothetical protein MTAT_04490 [Moorella thermoacetica]
MRVKYEKLRPEIEGYLAVCEGNLGVKADEIDCLSKMLQEVVQKKGEMPIKHWANLVHVLADAILDSEQEYSRLDKRANLLTTLDSLMPEVGEIKINPYQLEYILDGFGSGIKEE